MKKLLSFSKRYQILINGIDMIIGVEDNATFTNNILTKIKGYYFANNCANRYVVFMYPLKSEETNKIEKGIYRASGCYSLKFAQKELSETMKYYIKKYNSIENKK